MTEIEYFEACRPSQIRKPGRYLVQLSEQRSGEHSFAEAIPYISQSQNTGVLCWKIEEMYVPPDQNPDEMFLVIDDLPDEDYITDLRKLARAAVKVSCPPDAIDRVKELAKILQVSERTLGSLLRELQREGLMSAEQAEETAPA